MRGAPPRIDLGPTHLYVVEAGGQRLVVDAGPDYDGAWQQLEAALQTCGLTPGDIALVLLTHAHLDHSGLAARWQRAGVPVAAGRGDAPLLCDPHPAWFRDRLDATLREHGMPDDRRGRLLRGFGRYAFDQEGGRKLELRVSPVVPAVLLDEGPVPGIPGVEAYVVPGHTPGSLVFRMPGSGWCFTGDHVLEGVNPTPGIQFDPGGVHERLRSLPRYVRSLARTRDLPEQRFFPAHGDATRPLGGAVDRLLQQIERRAGRVRRRLRERAMSAWEITYALYPHSAGRHAWLLVAETLGLLDLLEEAGSVAPVKDADGVLRYRVGIGRTGQHNA